MSRSPKKSRLVRVFADRRRRGKRIEAGLRDSKTLALYRAARSLIAGKDFEEISVSRLAKAGGCSVGAFYGRFSDKRLFLEFLIDETFRRAESRAESALADEIGKGLAFEKIAKKIAEQISDQFGDEEFAGVVRAAVKLGFSDAKSRAPFDAYRKAAAGRAITLLAPHLRRGSEDCIREAMEAAFGILTDAAISESGHLRPRSARMNEALSAVIVKLAGAGGKSAGKLHPNKGNSPRIPRPEKLGFAPERPAPTPAKRKVRVL